MRLPLRCQIKHFRPGQSSAFLSFFRPPAYWGSHRIRGPGNKKQTKDPSGCSHTCEPRAANEQVAAEVTRLKLTRKRGNPNSNIRTFELGDTEDSQLQPPSFYAARTRNDPSQSRPASDSMNVDTKSKQTIGHPFFRASHPLPWRQKCARRQGSKARPVSMCMTDPDPVKQRVHFYAPRDQSSIRLPASRAEQDMKVTEKEPCYWLTPYIGQFSDSQ
jgi:hypothetical protein